MAEGPEDTAARVALWRALHVARDAPPHVIVDDVGRQLLAPADGWQERPDMSAFTRPFRASILARARFVEDLVADAIARGVDQYVILGAGLDTFAQRRPELVARARVFEIDQAGPQAWKRARLAALGLPIPPNLRFVPVDFEAGEAWTARLADAGFDPRRPAIVAATGLSMYLTAAANDALLRDVAALAPGSVLALSFMVPLALTDAAIRPGVERAMQGAAANGTPMISLFAPDELVARARAAGFPTVEHVASSALAARYFAGRTDGLRPPDRAEEILVART